jgi:general secretion pathway protein G
MGDYPPSRVLMREDGYMPTSLIGTNFVIPSGGTTPTDISAGTLAQRSITAFRKFWPRVQFNTSGAVTGLSTTTQWYDFNGNGTMDHNISTPNTAFVLQGNECLTFFLGGIPLNANGLYSMTGFGKSPTNPFANSIVGNIMYTANRSGPLFEFDSARLTLTPIAALPPNYGSASGSSFSMLPTSGIPGYVDSLNPPVYNFYAYFSSNVGSGYDPNDVNFNETDSLGTTSPITLQFPTLMPVMNSSTATVVSPSPNPYTSSGLVNVPNVSYIKADSFQLISPGSDSTYGVGGTYLPNSTTGALPPENAITNSPDPALRNVEGDNVTNFHNGRLQ